MSRQVALFADVCLPGSSSGLVSCKKKDDCKLALDGEIGILKIGIWLVCSVVLLPLSYLR